MTPMHICLAVEFFKDRFCKQELRWFEPLFQEIQLSEEREKCREKLEQSLLYSFICKQNQCLISGQVQCAFFCR